MFIFNIIDGTYTSWYHEEEFHIFNTIQFLISFEQKKR